MSSATNNSSSNSSAAIPISSPSSSHSSAPSVLSSSAPLSPHATSHSPLSSSPSTSPSPPPPSPRSTSTLARMGQRGSAIASMLPLASAFSQSSPSLSSPSTTAAAAPPAALPPLAIDKNITVGGGVKEITSKPVSKLPVAKDWLRLSHTFRVLDRLSGKVLFNSDTGTSEDAPDLERGFAMLKALYTSAETEEDAASLEQLFQKHVARKDADFAEQFQHFLEEANEELATIKAMKCVCQDVIYPAVMYYRQLIYPKYPFKDNKGTWHIDVAICKHRSRRADLTVTHHKGQLSHEPDMFSFDWDLEMEIKTSGDIQAQLYVTDYRIHDSVIEPQKSELISLLEPELHPNIAFQRFLTQVPSAVRPWTLLTSGVSIIQSGKILFQSALLDSVPEAKYRIICTIAQYFDGAETGPLLARVTELNQQSGFIDFQKFPSEPKFLKCVSLLSQDFIFFAYKRLRERLHARFPFKDKRDSVREANLKFSSTHITVCHRKVEQSTSQQFEFSWELYAKLNTDFDLVKTDLRITSYTFFDMMPASDRSDWLLAASGLLDRHTKERQAVPVQALCALRACCTALETKHSVPMVMVPGLASPMPVATVLSEVINSLANCPSLPPVHIRPNHHH
ncbi:hypothetical protein Pelo_4782 [Pelomyxa schiedti]|nr:hypothetical protein Pelo_4782 [Pelomyxa schiedti]